MVAAVTVIKSEDIYINYQETQSGTKGLIHLRKTRSIEFMQLTSCSDTITECLRHEESLFSTKGKRRDVAEKSRVGV